MAGASRKAPNAIAGHRAKDRPLQLVPPRESPPPVTRGWWKGTKTLWDEYWTSSVASQVDRAADLPALRELFDAQDELARLKRVAKAQPLVAGSMGQLKLNPATKRIDTLRSYLLAAGARFGLDPLSRARLGWTLSEGATAAQRLRRLMDDEPDDEPAAGEDGAAIEGEWEPL